MHSATVVVGLVLLGFASASPLALEAAPQAPQCTHTIHRIAPEVTDCTFRANTTTVTSYTDCAGCALSFHDMGVGVACHEKTILPGVATRVFTACAASPTAPSRVPGSVAATPTHPSGAVTTGIGGGIWSGQVTGAPRPSCTKAQMMPLGDGNAPDALMAGELGMMQNVPGPCTKYEKYEAKTKLVACGGCVVNPVFFAPGPAVKCESWATESLGYSTVLGCL